MLGGRREGRAATARHRDAAVLDVLPVTGGRGRDPRGRRPRGVRPDLRQGRRRVPMTDVRAISITSAQSFCDRWHSHHEPPIGGLFALSAWVDDRCVCVVIVSRPVARRLQEVGAVEVVRLASDGSVRGVASTLLRACVRECAARGYSRVVSYTLVGEVGACYRAARWRPTAITRGGEWSSPSRPRAPSRQPGDKIRWEAGAGALPRSMEAQRLCEQHAGQVSLRTRERAQQEMSL